MAQTFPNLIKSIYCMCFVSPSQQRSNYSLLSIPHMTNHLTDTRYHLSFYCVFNNTLFVRLGVCPLCSQHSKLATGYNLREFNRPQTGMCPFLLHDIILFPRNCSLKFIKHTRLRIPTQDHAEKGANTQTKGHNTPTSYINCSKTQYTKKTRGNRKHYLTELEMLFVVLCSVNSNTNRTDIF